MVGMKNPAGFLESYRPHGGLPALAGVTDFKRAAGDGLSVDECVARLKWLHWGLRRLHEVFIARLTSEPVYELKMVFSLHAHYCAEHAAALRKRVGEMREPPLGLNTSPDAGLDLAIDELLSAPDSAALLTGIYAVVVPEIERRLARHLEETNPLVDHPSVRVCRFALLEVREMAEYGRKALEALAGGEEQSRRTGWVELLQEALAGRMPARAFSASPRPFDPVPQRDERFPDPYNMGVHAEAFLYDESLPVEPKTLMLYYKRLREIDVPEMMASILAQTPGKPWDYVVDMTRQLWDEARHAMMGEVGFVQAGIDWREMVKVNFTWSLALNTQLEPLERHAVLYFIEQGLMPKTGKRYEWETAIASGEGFAALIQDYDWADEVLHARIGRDWYVSQIGDRKKAIEYGDECWSRVLIDWRSYVDRGLTGHANWWPALYAEWCRIRGEEPDPEVLAYATSYEAVRADLKDLSVSG
jgi:hypothetical protein